MYLDMSRSAATPAKRILFHNVEEIPILIEDSPELSSEIYDFLALAFRANITPWWSKISRYDKEFIPVVAQVTSAVIRALHARATRHIDPAEILLHDLPWLLTQHYKDYRVAEAKLHTSYAVGGSASLPQLFHQQQSHIALCQAGLLDDEYLRQIVDHILRASLPPEDYEPEPERFIVREIVLKILRDTLPRISQPWFIHKVILDVLGNEDPPLPPRPPTPPSLSRGIVALLSFLQAFSTSCLALIAAYRYAAATYHASPPLSQPTKLQEEPPPSPAPSFASSAPTLSPSYFPSPPDHARPAVTLISEVLSAKDRFASGALFYFLDGSAAASSPILDRLLPHLVENAITSKRAAGIVSLAKNALFPGGYPAPPVPEPSLEEQAELRTRLASRLLRSIPGVLSPLLLGPHPLATIDAALTPLSDPVCNLHLVVLIFERIVAGLFPELLTSATPN